MILSIETGTEICSVALSKGNELISLRESDEGMGHARQLAIFIDEVLNENNIDVSDLKAVAVSKGPGSYTGLRIGVSVAKGICYGASIPLIAVNSLKSLASVALEDYQAGILELDNFEDAILCPMIDARRMEVYDQLFTSSMEELTSIKAEIIDETSFLNNDIKGELIIFGSGASKCRNVIKHEKLVYWDIVPSARGVVKLAYKAFLEKKFEDVAYFEPLYLKEFTPGISSKKLGFLKQ